MTAIHWNTRYAQVNTYKCTNIYTRLSTRTLRGQKGNRDARVFLPCLTSAMLCIAVCCSVLQCVAVCCSLLLSVVKMKYCPETLILIGVSTWVSKILICE